MVPVAAGRHPHLAAPRRAGALRVDMHLHTMWSGDASTTPDELATAVAESDVDVLCITDHSAVAGAQRYAASGELGCRVIVGQELRTVAGEIIGLFMTERVPFGLSPEEACAEVHRQGGVCVVPHPFDHLRRALETPVLDRLVEAGHVDAIEVFNAKVRAPSANRQALDYAATRELPGTAGSDAHEPSAIGAAYVEMDDFDGPDTFLAALSAGTVVGHLYDAARTWRPRIVPSTSTPRGAR